MKLPNQNALTNSLKALINAFDTIIEILSKQTEAVISHNLDEVNRLAEQQISSNGDLKEREDIYQAELAKAYEQMDHSTEQQSLSYLLQNLDEEHQELTELRDELVKKINEAQTTQNQLNELLLFAQEHVNDTLRAIYALGNQQSVHYNSTGKKSQSERSIINKTG